MLIVITIAIYFGLSLPSFAKLQPENPYFLKIVVWIYIKIIKFPYTMDDLGSLLSIIFLSAKY